ncbi:hypothetical protein CBM2615_A280346 [Cupriavidus taiwanensis]|nr:hypothetical protein CBM2615_A280346 [Cupriavidus taiwanensis]SOZ57356.1 hypothetical protein CBM2614_A250351 [Cupriavidus taiwanensis]SPA05826.1 hypothetical protein CBM2625_A200351 [Cupriavidus taiwanensis]
MAQWGHGNRPNLQRYASVSPRGWERAASGRSPESNGHRFIEGAVPAVDLHAISQAMRPEQIRLNEGLNLRTIPGPDNPKPANGSLVRRFAQRAGDQDRVAMQSQPIKMGLQKGIAQDELVGLVVKADRKNHGVPQGGNSNDCGGHPTRHRRKGAELSLYRKPARCLMSSETKPPELSISIF